MATHDEVQLSMNEIYERRARENEELARQRKEAIDQNVRILSKVKKKSRARTIGFFVGTFLGSLHWSKT